MRRELQETLTAKYPAFFMSHPDAPGRNHVGITCGDGWYALLDEMLGALAPLMEQNASLSNPPRLYEVGSEKGRLRILFRPLTPEMSSYVYQAKSRSELVCERCGAGKRVAAPHCENCPVA